MFLQIHTLTSYPASLLNRDDAGLAKRIPFGNATRLRVSSQCLKRHWREELQHQVPQVPDGIRTRAFFTRAVLPILLEGGIPASRAEKLVIALAKQLINGGVKETGELAQPILFGLRERDYFVDLLRQIASDTDSDESALKALESRLKSPEERNNLKAMKRSAAGLSAALFGRMVTSDLLARVDAPVHVAHAFTVHPAETEMDYFTVVDDLNRDDEAGAAHANQSELGSGIYYGYVVVDVPLLVSNLTGCDAKDWLDQAPDPARISVGALIHAVATCTPGAKLGSTAPHARAEFVLLEIGTQQPRTLANAYLDALRLAGTNPMQEAVQRLGDYLRRVDAMYGMTADTRLLSTVHGATDFAPLTVEPLDRATQRALDALWG